MSLTKEEKGLIIQMLKDHLKEVKETEKLPTDYVGFVAAESEYEKFVEGIIKKLK